MTKPPLGRTRLRAAWILAVVVDALQIGVFPLTIEGAVSPLNDALDLVAMVALVSLLGWHWSFLPSLVAELVPGLDLAPTWTIAVALATRGRSAVPAGSPAPKVINPELLPPEEP